MEANYFQNLAKLSIRELLRYYRGMQIADRKNNHDWKLRNKQDVMALSLFALAENFHLGQLLFRQCLYQALQSVL